MLLQHLFLGTKVGRPHDITGQHLVGCTLKDKAAEVQDIDVGADLPDQGHIVLNQEDSGAPLRHHSGQDIAESGVCLLIVEQYVTRALELADSVYLINRGQIVFSGPANEVQGDDLFERYLGIEVTG